MNFFDFSHSNRVVVKFSMRFLLMGLAFPLIFSSAIQFSSAVGTRRKILLDQTLSPAMSPTPAMSPSDFYCVCVCVGRGNIDLFHNVVAGKCDLFKGDWVVDPSGPVYTYVSCQWIESHTNCMKNGRPDTGYLHWRWAPQGCDLPKFDPYGFLGLMRNKSWAFIGDSIMGNQVPSLLCLLSQVENPVMVYHDKPYHSRTWNFPCHNFTVAEIWAPYLAKSAIFEDDNGVSSDYNQLHLDELDPAWTEQYNKFDYAVISGGTWFFKGVIYYKNNTIIGCHNCPGKNITELGFDSAYRKILQLAFNFITSSEHKAYVFFRTIAPDHYEGGEWNKGGYCNRTEPFKEGGVKMNDLDMIMHNIEREEFDSANALRSKNGMTLKLLDTTHLSLLRPDGHPGFYRLFHPFAKTRYPKFQIDCLHWCLPGPMDTWNDLMMEILVNG
ncbi:protein trichome birefringence-like 26 [Cornus florida]|uniref:protein trichome birefringence-like 26 n=1 Tax=Cornus florida TaxID=4283 RepID=UPI0028968EC2|nr:protein trichome birefringence-like 26 [Cornus florida]